MMLTNLESRSNLFILEHTFRLTSVVNLVGKYRHFLIEGIASFFATNVIPQLFPDFIIDVEFIAMSLFMFHLWFPMILCFQY